MLLSAAAVSAYLGDTRRAEILLQELRRDEGRIIIAGIATYWVGSIDQSLGLLQETLGRFDEAERYFASAAAVAGRAGARLIEAHTLCDRARVLRKLQTTEGKILAKELVERADATYQALGVVREGSTVTLPESPVSDVNEQQPSFVNRFLRNDRLWHLEYEGIPADLPDSKGLAYLQRLLAIPDEDVHVVELIVPDRSVEGSWESGRRGKHSDTSSSRISEARIEVLDAQARAAYRERLRDLEILLGEAERDNDLARLESLGTEREQVESELRAAFGLAGRPRSLGDPTERARKAVYNRIRSSIRRIEREHPALGRHLDRSIRTGTTCSYRPDRPTAWSLE